MQVTERLTRMYSADISFITKVIPLVTLHKSDSNTDVLPAILKILEKTHKKLLRWRQFLVYLWRVD